MMPKRMAGGQRLGVGDVEDGSREMPGIQGGEERRRVELRAPTGMDQRRPLRQAGEELGIQETARCVRQRQEADEDVGSCQKCRQPVRAMKAIDAIDLAGGPAPAGERKAEGSQPLHGRLGQHALAQKPDAALARLPGGARLPR